MKNSQYTDKDFYEKIKEQNNVKFGFFDFIMVLFVTIILWILLEGLMFINSPKYFF